MSRIRQARFKIFKFIKYMFSFSNMPDIALFPQLTESKFNTNSGCLRGILVYATVALDRLSGLTPNSYSSHNKLYRALELSISKYQSLLMNPLIWKLKQVHLSTEVMTQIYKVVSQSKCFYCGYEDQKNNKQESSYHFTNKDRIATIHGVKLFYDSSKVSLDNILKANLPTVLIAHPMIKDVVGYDSQHRLIEY